MASYSSFSSSSSLLLGPWMSRSFAARFSDFFTSLVHSHVSSIVSFNTGQFFTVSPSARLIEW